MRKLILCTMTCLALIGCATPNVEYEICDDVNTVCPENTLEVEIEGM